MPGSGTGAVALNQADPHLAAQGVAFLIKKKKMVPAEVAVLFVMETVLQITLFNT